MSFTDFLADGAVALYGMNRRSLRLRGGYRLLKAAGRVLPKLHRYPIHFPETAAVYADVENPDTYWLLNAYLGDEHSSMLYLTEIAQLALPPDAVVWDVGGSMGLFSSRVAIKSFGLKALHFFEPHPTPRAVAEGLLGANPIIHFHPFALGKTEGTAELHFGTGTGSASIKIQPDHDPHHITCRIEVGDALLEAGAVADAPDLIKIDVEGFEPEVIQGLAKTIAVKKPVIFFEIIFLTDEVVLGIVPDDYRIAYIRDSDGKLMNDLPAGRKEGVMDAIMAPRDAGVWQKLAARFGDKP
jgi:FkbM family methyltransferase